MATYRTVKYSPEQLEESDTLTQAEANEIARKVRKEEEDARTERGADEGAQEPALAA